MNAEKVKVPPPNKVAPVVTVDEPMLMSARRHSQMSTMALVQQQHLSDEDVCKLLFVLMDKH